MRLNQSFNLNYLGIGLFLFLLASAILVWKMTFIIVCVHGLAVILVILGTWKVLEWLLHPSYHVLFKRRIPTGVLGLLEVILGGMIYFGRQASPYLLTLLIGSYQIIIGIVASVSYFLLWRDRVRNQWSQLLNTCIHLGFGLASLFLSNKVDHTLIRLAIYLILLALNYIYDGQNISKRYVLNYQKRNIRLPLPLFLTVLMPYQLMKNVLKLMDHLEDKHSSLKQAVTRIPRDKDLAVNLEVFIHTSPYGFDRFGHVDVAYQGKVYSYGNHDADARRFFDMVGEGVYLIADRSAYIKFMTRRKITIISFGLHLNQAEMEQFQANLDKLNHLIQPFSLSSPNQLSTFVGLLTQENKVSMYKFTQGQFKTYFVLGTNCVLFVDYLLWTSGMDIMAFAGIMTPGTYYDYLNKELHKQESKVISRRIYNQRLIMKEGEDKYEKAF